MNCPSCKAKINDNDLVCPNCKKVLKLQCHNCGAINKNGICEKCGTVILNKCYKCGKLNSTTITNCPRCGMDVNASIGLRESLIEEFAVLTIGFTNFGEIKSVLKSTKLAEKFKNNIYEIIKKNALQKKLRVQILDDVFIIRFCKDYSFQESCKSAIDFSIYIAQTVTELNRKLFDAKGIELKVQMAVLKRDVYAKSDEYKSGLNINVVYSSSDSMRVFSAIEVAVDSFVYQATKEFYPFQSLSAVCVKNKMIMFFELILAQLIKLEQEKDIEAEQVKLPKNIDYVPNEDYLNEQLISFKGLNCSFIYAKSTKLEKELEKIASKQMLNPLISVRSDERLGKLDSVRTQIIRDIFKDYQICRISCSRLNKFNPYGLLKQLMLAQKNITELELFSNFPEYRQLFTDDNLVDLFRMEATSDLYPEDYRYYYFEAFTTFISAIPYKTLFVIDDLHYADEVSIEIIKYLYENNKLGNVGFLISSSLEWVLHRKICQLMIEPNYYDIEIKPSSNKSIVKSCDFILKNIKDSFFYEKALENTNGSLFYFKQALSYLYDNGVLDYKNGQYCITDEKMVVLPSDINVLIQKRIKKLLSVKNLFELYASLLLIGEKVSLSILDVLHIKDCVKLIKILEQRNFISLQDDKFIIISNYNLFLRNFLQVVEQSELEELVTFVLETIYSQTQFLSAQKAELLEFAKLKKEAFAHWHSLAMVSSRLGDFCAYMNCTNKFLGLVDNVIDSSTDKSVEQVKMEVYAELAVVMYKYYPEKIISYLQALLTDLEIKQDDTQIKDIANKLIQCCLMSGYYNNALEYLGKIISRMPKSSFNPDDKNFNLNYFLLNLISTEVYFNLGKLNECIEIGDEVLKNIDVTEFKQMMLPETVSKQDFDDSILDAHFYVVLSYILKGHPNTQSKLSLILNSEMGKYSCFKLLALLVDLLACKDISVELENWKHIKLNDKYSQIILDLLFAFNSLLDGSLEDFSNFIYNAKVQAEVTNQHQFKYFCDLMIGYAYQNIGNIKKTKQIYYNVLEAVDERGINTIMYLALYFITLVGLAENEVSSHLSLFNKTMLKIESDKNSSTVLNILYKTMASELMFSQNNNVEQAMYCAEQVFDITLRTRYFIFSPKIANILMAIYNLVLNSNSEDAVKREFQLKIQNLNNIMSQLHNM